MEAWRAASDASRRIVGVGGSFEVGVDAGGGEEERDGEEEERRDQGRIEGGLKGRRVSVAAAMEGAQSSQVGSPF